MLQQTRVVTAVAYYERFVDRFPDLHCLAAAPLEEVLGLWAGLGYYARARHAHACAKALVADHGGRFPRTARDLERLPGIGASTAAAIAAFCFGERVAILDANVKRVLARRHAIDGDPRRPDVLEELWRHARALLPGAAHMGAYTQAIMDLGASVCTRSRARCELCPVRSDCKARLQGRVAELPSRARAAARPVRTAHFLVAVHRRSVLLEQRAATGIWGGLLSVPQFATRTGLRAAAQGLGATRPPQPLAQRLHGFTHFTLACRPHLLRLSGTRPRLRAPQWRWLSLAQIEGAALPAPILALLRDLRDGLADL